MCPRNSHNREPVRFYCITCSLDMCIECLPEHSTCQYQQVLLSSIYINNNINNNNIYINNINNNKINGIKFVEI